MKRDIVGEIEESSRISDRIAQQAKAIQDDYRYMDNVPLEGWAWEFIRRNPKYKILYEAIKQDFETIDVIKGDSDFESIMDNIQDSPIKKRFKQLYDNFLIKAYILENKPFDISKLENTNKLSKKIVDELKSFLNILPEDADNFMKVKGLNLFIGIPNPETKYDEFCCHFPIIDGATSVRYFKFDKYTGEKFISGQLKSAFKEYCYKAMMDLSPIHSSETIYFGVSVNGKKEDIMQQVKKILNEYIKPTKERQQGDNKWKYYLIAYDFVDKGMKYSEIANILSVAFEHDKRLFDEKNIENYYKTGLKLINDGYKKYLYLKK